ncbi:MAG TPA: efflux RND transporter permease subunit, partial [Phycisphaerae bacterium]|nr:efflux RND transporter permease subunit [Phycisphaerae bacterium]
MKSLPAMSVHNPVVVNLMMLAILGAGLFSAMTIVREMFPESRPNQVMIMTPYPGASPAEVEKGITIKIEEQIKDVEGIEKVVSIITEGSSAIMAQLYNGVDDIDRVVNDIKNKIDAIPRTDFPEEAEETVVSRFEPTLPVISVSWYGDMTEEQLKTMGKRLRDDILELPDITRVQLSGTRRDEISVEVQPEQLLRYGLSFMDVTDAIHRGSMDLPGGQVKTRGANVAVRTLGERDRGDELEGLIVRGGPAGEVVRLADVARIRDAFEDVDVESRIDGEPGVSVIVSKTADQDAILISERVKALVAGKNGQPFVSSWQNRLTGREKELRKIYDAAAATPYPKIGTLKTHSNLARFIEGRLDLLVRNGFWGALFVFLSLLFFLHWRVAFWVMMGLVVAILGTLAVMHASGITLNLISMFGLIVVLGMLVDDAIVVGEHIYTKIEEGLEPELAAARGAEEVTYPVLAAVTTTMLAFAPMMLLEGRIGDFMRVLPIIVIISLGISLFEALSILPSHLSESFMRAARRAHRHHAVRTGWWSRSRAWLRARQVAFFEGVLRRSYRRMLETVVAYRYVTIAVAVAGLIVVGGLIGGGKVPIVFFQKMDAETLLAELELPIGSPLDRTDAVMKRIEAITDDIPEINTRYSLIGSQMNISGDGLGTTQSHAGQMIMELLPSEERDRTSEDILNELRRRSAGITGVNSLVFTAVHGGPAGAAIQIEVSGDDLDQLVEVTGRLKDDLRGFAGVTDIEDDFDAGQREVQVELLESGRVLGLTTESLATQVRAAFYGLEARKVQRDREDVKIMVRYPESRRHSLADLEHMRVAVPDGTLVPIREVARITERTGYATIRRKDQHRTVTVQADVDQGVANSEEVLGAMEPRFEALQHAYPGTSIALAGQTEETRKFMHGITEEALMAMGLIYAILAALFRSYIQPAIVMMAIPFGVIGAVAGHLLMGYPLTFMSMIGLVALTGIVVNDSLILVDFINQRVRGGIPVTTAVVEGGLARLRAIMLTSITTILGLAPLMLEQSFQAKFLIPMAVSIAFGLAFATVLTLVVVPCLYVMVDDWVRA